MAKEENENYANRSQGLCAKTKFPRWWSVNFDWSSFETTLKDIYNDKVWSEQFLYKSCSAGAKKFTNYVFCHPQFSGVIQNIENCCA